MIPSGFLMRVLPSLDLSGTIEDVVGPKTYHSKLYKHFESHWAYALWTSVEMLDHHFVFISLNTCCIVALFSLSDFFTIDRLTRFWFSRDACRLCLVSRSWFDQVVIIVEPISVLTLGHSNNFHSCWVYLLLEVFPYTIKGKTVKGVRELFANIRLT